MKVSVIIPAYNAAPWIEHCIESIFSQNCEGIEIIIIDDGSTDKTLQICQLKANDNTNIRVLHKERGGVSSARNMGIEYASGDYLMFVDADDHLIENSLKRVIELAYNNFEADLCIFGYIRSSRNGSESLSMLKPRIYRKEERLEYLHSLDALTFGSMCNKLYKREFINSHNLRCDTKIIALEDIHFNLKVLESASCIVTSEKIVYYYDVNTQSATAQFIGHKYLENARMYLDMIANAVENISASMDPHKQINKIYKANIIEHSKITTCHNTLYQIYNLYKQKNKKIFNKLVWMNKLINFMYDITPDWQSFFSSGFPKVFVKAYCIHPRLADVILRIIFKFKN